MRDRDTKHDCQVSRVGEEIVPLIEVGKNQNLELTLLGRRKSETGTRDMLLKLERDQNYI